MTAAILRPVLGRILCALWVLSTNACLSQVVTARAFVEADGLFQQDPRWLGADGALSISLSDGRILWLYGDTFLATSDANVRAESEMVRNTVAIQIGSDPRTADMTFYWRESGAGLPASFFPERGNIWYWPGHGIRLSEGPLVVFLYAIQARPGQGLGFASTGYALAIVDSPDTPPEKWKPRVFDAAPAAFDAIPATAVVDDGDHIVAVAIRQVGTHAGALVRYQTASLAQGDVSSAEWWGGDARGWVPASMLGDDGPEYVLPDAGSECSLHWDERTSSFIHVASYGFGASTIGVRTAPALTGPWSDPVMIYRPPESDSVRPFVYAARAHPALSGPEPTDMVLTYATNSPEFNDLLSENGMRSLYWPRFVVVPGVQ